MPPPPSSARTNSSHRSSLEPRGPPEFDREYARQLSLAKRGRSSLKTSPRTEREGTTPYAEGRSPPPDVPLPTRAKNAADQRASPRRPPGPGLPLGKARGGEDDAGSPDEDSNAPRMLNATQSCADLTDTHSDGATTTAGPGTESTGGGLTVKDVVRIFLSVWAVLFFLLCCVSLLVSDDRSYNPIYFSRGATAAAAAARGVSSGAGGAADATPYVPTGVDRLIPQLNRQMALRVRLGARRMCNASAPLQAAGIVAHDIAAGVRLCGRTAVQYLVQPVSSAVGGAVRTSGRAVRRSLTILNPAHWFTGRPGGRRTGRGRGIAAVTSGIAKVYQAAVVVPLRTVRWVFVRPPQMAVLSARNLLANIQRAAQRVRVRLPTRRNTTLEAKRSEARVPAAAAPPAKPNQPPAAKPAPQTPVSPVQESVPRASAAGNKKTATTTTKTSPTSPHKNGSNSTAATVPWGPKLAAVQQRAVKVVRESYGKAGVVVSQFGRSAARHARRTAERLWRLLAEIATRLPRRFPRIRRSEALATQQVGTPAAKPALVTVKRTAQASIEHTITGEDWGWLLKENPEEVQALVELELQTALRIPANARDGAVRLRNVKLSEGSLKISFLVEQDITVKVPQGDESGAAAETGKASAALLRESTRRVTAHRFTELWRYHDRAIRQRAAERTKREAAAATSKASRLEASKDPQQQQQQRGLPSAEGNPCATLAELPSSAPDLRTRCAREWDVVCNATAVAKEASAACAQQVTTAQLQCEEAAKAARETAALACRAEREATITQMEAACTGRVAASAQATARTVGDLNATHAAAMAALQAKCDAADAQLAALRQRLQSAKDAQTNESAAMLQLREELMESRAESARCAAEVREMRSVAAQGKEEALQAAAQAKSECEKTKEAAVAEAAKACAQRVEAAARESTTVLLANCSRERAAIEKSFAASCDERLSEFRNATVSTYEARLAACRKEMASVSAAERAQAAALHETEAAFIAAKDNLREVRESCLANLTATETRFKEDSRAAAAKAEAACAAQLGAAEEQSVAREKASLSDTRAGFIALHEKTLHECEQSKRAEVNEAKRAAADACERDKQAAEASFVAQAQRKQDAAVSRVEARVKESQDAIMGFAVWLNEQCARVCRSGGGTETECSGATAVDLAALNASTLAQKEGQANLGLAAVSELRRNLAISPGSGRDSLAAHCTLSWPPNVQRAVASASAATRAQRWRRMIRKSLTCLLLGSCLVGAATVSLSNYQRAKDLAEKNAELAKALGAARAQVTAAPGDNTDVVAAASAADVGDSSTVLWLAEALDGYFEAMEAWHLTCCSLLTEHEGRADLRTGVADGGIASGLPRHSAGDGRLLSPPTSSDGNSSNSSRTAPFDNQGDRRDGVATARLSAAPAVSPERVDEPGALSVPPPQWGSSVATASLLAQSARVYFGTLESYYVDLLEAVTNRELVERQLEEMEGVAAKQASVLERQSGTVSKLQRLLDEERAASQREAEEMGTECAALRQQLAAEKAKAAEQRSGGEAERELAKARKMIALQAEMVSVLEEQLKRLGVARPDSTASAVKGRAAPSTPGRSPIPSHRDPAQDVSEVQEQLRSLVQRESAERQGIQNEPEAHSEFRKPMSTTHTPSPASTRPLGATDPRRDPSATTSMVRHESNMRRYRQLDWQDVDEGGDELH